MLKERMRGFSEESNLRLGAKEMFVLLKRAQKLGLITPNGRKAVREVLLELIEFGELAKSRFQGHFLEGEGQYIKILPEFSSEARAAIEAEGSRIIYPVEPLSLQQLMDNPDFEGKLGPIHDSSKLKAIVSPRTQIAFNPHELAIPGSERTYHKGPKDYQKMLEEHSRDLQTRYGREDLAVFMFPGMASALVQLDLCYQLNTGEVLIADFKNNPFYLKTADETTSPLVACVGRGQRGYRIGVSDWFSEVNRYYWLPSLLVPKKPLLSPV
jgi:hypothetical protein